LHNSRGGRERRRGREGDYMYVCMYVREREVGRWREKVEGGRESTKKREREIGKEGETRREREREREQG